MRGCGLIEITCPRGPRGGMRPGPGGDAIMFGPKAQKGVEVFLARTLAAPRFVLGPQGQIKEFKRHKV